MDEDVPSGSQYAQDKEVRIEGAATRVSPSTKSSEETCIICLEPISERAVATPCNHLTFDFLCLISWLQERPNCPLCKADVKEVQYDWRSVDDYKTYRVARAAVPALPSQPHHGRRSSRVVRPTVVSRDPSVERRRDVYRHRLYALHVGSNRFSRYREFSPAEYSRSPELQSRTRIFLRRELQVFTFLGNRDFLIEYIVAVLKKYEIKAADGKAEDLLKEFLGEANASNLLHELQAWLRSSFIALWAWDAEVQYQGLDWESDPERKMENSSRQCIH